MRVKADERRFWGFLYFQHRSDILAVQNYITAILIFLVIEMLMTWGFYGVSLRLPRSSTH